MIPTAPQKPFEVLLVEDSPGDIRLTFEAFKKTTIETRLHVVHDGAEALAFLKKEDYYAQSPRPDLILLDLNLPKVSGHEVLEEIKQNPDLKIIPVVVLTGSKSVEDIERAYAAHANCFVSKPNDLKDYFSVIRLIEDFWFSLAQLPS